MTVEKTIYKGHLINRVWPSGNYEAYTKAKYVQARTLEGIKQVIDNKDKMIKGDKITVYWIGFPVNVGTIGTYVVSPDVHDQTKDRFEGEISIDFWDEDVKTDRLNDMDDIVHDMKKTSYGELLFKND